MLNKIPARGTSWDFSISRQGAIKVLRAYDRSSNKLHGDGYIKDAGIVDVGWRAIRDSHGP
jgi:hypothetical protein